MINFAFSQISSDMLLRHRFETNFTLRKKFSTELPSKNENASEKNVYSDRCFEKQNHDE